MIRILIIDDAPKPEFVGLLCDEVKGSMGVEVQAHHLNPTGFFAGHDQAYELEQLLHEVSRKAVDFWDIALIDLNLHEVNVARAEKLHLSLSIAAKFREINKSAIVILYSGTLSDHVKELLAEPKVAEAAMKKIFRTDIAAFSPRNQITLEVIQRLSAPSFILTIDRALVADPNFQISTAEAEFTGKTFGQLATSVRCQDRVGVRLTTLVAEHGLAAIVDLAR